MSESENKSNQQAKEIEDDFIISLIFIIVVILAAIGLVALIKWAFISPIERSLEDQIDTYNQEATSTANAYEGDLAPADRGELVEGLRPTGLSGDAIWIGLQPDWYYAPHSSPENAFNASCEINLNAERPKPEQVDIIVWNDHDPVDFSCAPHEIGHLIDAVGGQPSTSADFAGATDQSITEFEDTASEDPESYGQPLWHLTMRTRVMIFPGIAGNPMGSWGGFVELYADLFSVECIDWIPPAMRSFYSDWLIACPEPEAS